MASGKYTKISCGEAPNGDQIASLARHESDGSTLRLEVREHINGDLYTTNTSIQIKDNRNNAIISENHKTPSSSIPDSELQQSVLDIKKACNVSGNSSFKLPTP